MSRKNDRNNGTSAPTNNGAMTSSSFQTLKGISVNTSAGGPTTLSPMASSSATTTTALQQQRTTILPLQQILQATIIEPVATSQDGDVETTRTGKEERESKKKKKKEDINSSKNEMNSSFPSINQGRGEAAPVAEKLAFSLQTLCLVAQLRRVQRGIHPTLTTTSTRQPSQQQPSTSPQEKKEKGEESIDPQENVNNTASAQPSTFPPSSGSFSFIFDETFVQSVARAAHPQGLTIRWSDLLQLSHVFPTILHVSWPMMATATSNQLLTTGGQGEAIGHTNKVTPSPSSSSSNSVTTTNCTSATALRMSYPVVTIQVCKVPNLQQLEQMAKDSLLLQNEKKVATKNNGDGGKISITEDCIEEEVSGKKITENHKKEILDETHTMTTSILEATTKEENPQNGEINTNAEKKETVVEEEGEDSAEGKTVLLLLSKKSPPERIVVGTKRLRDGSQVNGGGKKMSQEGEVEETTTQKLAETKNNKEKGGPHIIKKEDLASDLPEGLRNALSAKKIQQISGIIQQQKKELLRKNKSEERRIMERILSIYDLSRSIFGPKRRSLGYERLVELLAAQNRFGDSTENVRRQLQQLVMDFPEAGFRFERNDDAAFRKSINKMLIFSSGGEEDDDDEKGGKKPDEEDQEGEKKSEGGTTKKSKKKSITKKPAVGSGKENCECMTNGGSNVTPENNNVERGGGSDEDETKEEEEEARGEKNKEEDQDLYVMLDRECSSRGKLESAIQDRLEVYNEHLSQ